MKERNVQAIEKLQEQRGQMATLSIAECMGKDLNVYLDVEWSYCTWRDGSNYNV